MKRKWFSEEQFIAAESRSAESGSGVNAQRTTLHFGDLAIKELVECLSRVLDPTIRLITLNSGRSPLHAMRPAPSSLRNR